MNKQDFEFFDEIFSDSPLLFYGELEGLLNDFAKRVFQHEFREYGFGEIEMTDDFATAYWIFISLLCKAKLFDYGTSPRGGWLTERGERFKRIILESENAFEDYMNYVYKETH